MRSFACLPAAAFARRALLPALLPLLVAGCAGTYRLDATPAQTSVTPQQVLAPLWRRAMVERGFMAYKPQEWAAASFNREAGLVYVGSSAGRMEALRASDGHPVWRVYTEGPVASEPLYVPSTGTLYFGADDGKIYAVDAETGAVRWRYTTQGTINPRPVLHQGMLLFTSSEGRIYALDAGSGKWRWQYDRQAPEGFTIHGYSGVAVLGDKAYAGFSDGVLAALKAGTGEVLWTRNLAGDATQFVDVDATPQVIDGQLVTACHATGVYALDPENGSVRWHYPVEGAAQLTVHRGRIYFGAPRVGVVALDPRGQKIWRQAMPEGVPTRPVLAGPYLFVSTTERGLYVASARTGKLLQVFDPGEGISAPATANAGMLTVLGNGGTLFAFQLAAL